VVQFSNLKEMNYI